VIAKSVPVTIKTTNMNCLICLRQKKLPVLPKNLKTAYFQVEYPHTHINTHTYTLTHTPVAFIFRLGALHERNAFVTPGTRIRWFKCRIIQSH